MDDKGFKFYMQLAYPFLDQAIDYELKKIKGRKNMKKPRHANIGFALYQSFDSISSTDIRNMLRSPAYYKYHSEHPKDSPAMAFGTAFHTAVLEPELFEKNYIRLIDGDGRSKEVKEFKAVNSDKTILSGNDYDLIMAMKQSIYNNLSANTLLNTDYNKNWTESSIFWTDEITGLKCKCRPDRLVRNDNLMICVDLKTTTDASPEKFQKSIIDYGYYIQAAHYLQGVRQYFPSLASYVFYIIAIEKSAPFQIAVYKIDNSFIELGDKQIEKALRQFKTCFEINQYEGYSKTPLVMYPPLWLFDKIRL
jgi:hypothetical protein